MDERPFHEQQRDKMDSFVHLVYSLTKKFPREELYGVTSQLRRAALSVVLNYIEGFARGNVKVNKNFLRISFGSLKESKYLLEFCLKENFLTPEEHRAANQLADEIGAMLWSVIQKMPS